MIKGGGKKKKSWIREARSITHQVVALGPNWPQKEEK